MTDEILPKVLTAGGEVVLAKVKSNLHSVIGQNTKYESRSTGELENSLGFSPARRDRNENWNVKIGFAEPRRSGKTNAMIGNVLEYGKAGQPPKPFLKPAKTQSKAECTAAMKQKFEELTR
jgi:hypothetical protein